MTFCNPLLDISLEVDDMSFLDKYCLKPSNAILAKEEIHHKLIQDVYNNERKMVIPGGSGLNTIRAANVSLIFLFW